MSAYIYICVKIDGQNLIVKHERICKRFIIYICARIYDIRILHIGVREMGVNLRRKIIFKSRQMVFYSNSLKPCQNYLTLQYNQNGVKCIHLTYPVTHLHYHTKFKITVKTRPVYDTVKIKFQPNYLKLFNIKLIII